jgi:hypothetical protein
MVPCWAVLAVVLVLLLILVVLVVLAFTVIIPQVIDTLLDDATIEFDLVKLSKPGNMSLYLDAGGSHSLSRHCCFPSSTR